MAGFVEATAVSPSDVPGQYDAVLDPDWSIGGRPHGGYLLALLGRAAVDASRSADSSAAGGVAADADRDASSSPHPHPLAASAHYVRSPRSGPARVHVEPLRVGRRMSQVRARLVQQGATQVEALFTLGTLPGPDTEPWWHDDSPVPALPAPTECVRAPSSDPSSGLDLTVMKMVDLDLDPAGLGFAVGAPAGRGELAGHLRFADGFQPDALALLFAVDVLPPATADLGSAGWVPTLELTVYTRALPVPGALAVRHRARLVTGSLMDEVCEVRDGRGRVVAQATQLAAPRLSGAAVTPSRRQD